MRHAMANRRRNRQGGQNHRPQHNKATVFDSNGPDVRIRGTAYQIVEKYLTLAKDATSSGDRVLAENYFQHAEHYQRLINSWTEEEAARYPYANDPRNEEPAMPVAESREADVVVTRPARAQSDDDLSLPASILGVSSSTTPSTGSTEGNTRETRTPVSAG